MIHNGDKVFIAMLLVLRRHGVRLLRNFLPYYFTTGLPATPSTFLLFRGP